MFGLSKLRIKKLSIYYTCRNLDGNRVLLEITPIKQGNAVVYLLNSWIVKKVNKVYFVECKNPDLCLDGIYTSIEAIINECRSKGYSYFRSLYRSRS